MKSKKVLIGVSAAVVAALVLARKKIGSMLGSGNTVTKPATAGTVLPHSQPESNGEENLGTDDTSPPVDVADQGAFYGAMWAKYVDKFGNMVALNSWDTVPVVYFNYQMGHWTRDWNHSANDLKLKLNPRWSSGRMMSDESSNPMGYFFSREAGSLSPLSSAPPVAPPTRAINPSVFAALVAPPKKAVNPGIIAAVVNAISPTPPPTNIPKLPIATTPISIPPNIPAPACVLVDHVGNKYAIPEGMAYNGDGDIFQADDGVLYQIDCTGHGFTYRPSTSTCNLIDQYGNATAVDPNFLSQQGFGDGDPVRAPDGTLYTVSCPTVSSHYQGQPPQGLPQPAVHDPSCVLVDEFGGVSPIDATSLVDYQDGDVFQAQDGSSYTVQCGQQAEPEEFVQTFGREAESKGVYVIGVKKRLKKVKSGAAK